MTLLEVIDKAQPAERGTFLVHIMPYGVDLDIEWPKVLQILRDCNVQNTVSMNSNKLNPINVCFEKYVVSKPDHGIRNWGFEYRALCELCLSYQVWIYDNVGEQGYAFDHSLTVTKIWTVEEGT